MVIEYAGPLVAAANFVNAQLAGARKANVGTVQALMGYSAGIEAAIHALVNETRTILVVAATDLDDDEAMRELRLRIETYLGVHHIYEPLKDAKVEAEQTLQLLDKRASTLLNLKDLNHKKREALLAYRDAFTGVLAFIDELEAKTVSLPYQTGLLGQQMPKLREIVSLDHDKRLARRDEVRQSVSEGFAELDNAFPDLTERLVKARHQILAAFS
jgi:hypothetical protein